MTDQHADPAHDAIAEHDAVTHMDAHTAISDDDHGHGEQALGPIDWRAWGLAILGAAAGLIVLAAFWLSLNQLHRGPL
jgi:hypothetical protein